MQTPVHIVALDSLAFMRDNAKVFQKYFFLPLILSIVGLLLEAIPMAGLALSTVADSAALALVGVSVTRFTIMKDAERVALGANRPFARFFFLLFMLTAASQIGKVFDLLPASAGMGVFWMLVMAYLNLKLSLTFPALAMDHPGAVIDNMRLSFVWTSGRLFKLITALMICYSPMVFFLMMIIQLGGFDMGEKTYWERLPQLAFSNVLIVFSTMWSSIVLAKFYEDIALNNQ